MNNEQWDAEVSYCVRLIKNRGNISVPRESVRNYLATQASMAFRDRAEKLAEAFTSASNHIAAGDWQAAEHVLRVVWLTV